MLERSSVELELTPFEVQVTAERLQAFAKATGQDDPVYTDLEAAQRAGYPCLPVPPTYLFCLEFDAPNPQEVYERLGIPYAQVLHAEQHFVYHRIAFAGQTLRFAPRIGAQTWKKNGSLCFVERLTRVEDADGAPVADLCFVMVVRAPERSAGP